MMKFALENEIAEKHGLRVAKNMADISSGTALFKFRVYGNKLELEIFKLIRFDNGGLAETSGQFRKDTGHDYANSVVQQLNDQNIQPRFFSIVSMRTPRQLKKVKICGTGLLFPFIKSALENRINFENYKLQEAYKAEEHHRKSVNMLFAASELLDQGKLPLTVSF